MDFSVNAVLIDPAPGRNTFNNISLDSSLFNIKDTCRICIECSSPVINKMMPSNEFVLIHRRQDINQADSGAFAVKDADGFFIGKAIMAKMDFNHSHFIDLHYDGEFLNRMIRFTFIRQLNSISYAANLGQLYKVNDILNGKARTGRPLIY